MTRRPAILLLIPMLLLAACAPQPTETPAPATALPASPTPFPPTATMTEPPTLTPTPPPSLTPTPPPVVTTPPTEVVPTTPTPGIIVHGYVKLEDGTGLPGVTICRNFASYNGVVVATTDANGYFQSDFAFIPGDEMIGVWALAPGYTFDPPSYRWRHYYGPEERPLDFMAMPASTAATPTPPAPCP